MYMLQRSERLRGGDLKGVARRWEEMVLVQLRLMVRSGRKGGRLIEEDMIAIEERDAACFQ